jgi:hypothetical protein
MRTVISREDEQFPDRLLQQLLHNAPELRSTSSDTLSLSRKHRPTDRLLETSPRSTPSADTPSADIPPTT